MRIEISISVEQIDLLTEILEKLSTGPLELPDIQKCEVEKICCQVENCLIVEQ